MMHLLSQVVETPQMPHSQQVSDLAQRIRDWKAPTLPELLDQLAGMDVTHGLILLAAGILCLLAGWKIFRVVVVLNGLALGGALGWMLGTYLNSPDCPVLKAAGLQQWASTQNLPMTGAVALGLLLGFLAWPMVKWAVRLSGMSVGSVAGELVWRSVVTHMGRTDLLQYSWAGMGAGFILMGFLSFALFKLAIEIITSLQGAMMAMAGLLVLACKHEKTRVWLLEELKNRPLLLAIVIGGVALIGLIFQRIHHHRHLKAQAPQAQ